MSISLRYVSYRYPGANENALQDISFDASPGQLLLLVGHNGAGKSTLLRLLNGMLRPSNGSVHICGQPIEHRPTSNLASDVAVTFQNPSDQIFASTVRQEIAFGPRNLRRATADILVEEALHLCGIADASERHPYHLLPPERKLLTIASAIAMDTAVFAFDEPSAGLSQRERTRLTDALRHLLLKGKTVLVISHDLGVFLRLAQHIVVLDHGRMMFGGGTREFESELVRFRRTGVRLPFPARISAITRSYQ